MCLYPMKILNRKFLPNKKNGGKPPKASCQEIKVIEIPCGKCIECLQVKARNWKIRLTEELKKQQEAYFITLTLSNESIEEIGKNMEEKEANEIAKKAVELWRERVRKQTGKSPRHWLVTELGGNKTERIHLHGILFGPIEAIEKWKYGFTYVGYECSQKTISYICKYIHKPDKKHPGYTPIVLTSPGIGKDFIESKEAGNIINQDKYIMPNGKKISAPKYYRDRLLDEEEREKRYITKQREGKVFFRGKEYNINDQQSAIELEFARKSERERCEKMGLEKRKKKKYAATNNFVVENFEF